MAKIIRIFTCIVCIIFGKLGQATTYYNKTAANNASATSAWTTNSSGGAGTSPSNFTTSGDIFIIRATYIMYHGSDWTIGSGVTLDIYGTMRVGNWASYGCGLLGLSTCYDYYSLLMNTNSTLFVRNGGTLEFYYDHSGISMQMPAVARTTFESNSLMLFSDGAEKFDPAYNYGNLTFNDGGNTPSMGTVYGLRVQGNLTISDINASIFVLSTTASLTHTIGGSLIMNNVNKNFVVANGAGAPTLNVGGNLTLTNGGFYEANSTGSPTVNVTGGVTVGNAYFVINNFSAANPVMNITGTTSITAGYFKACNSTGSATVTMGPVSCSSPIPVPQTSPETHQFEIKTTSAAAGISPSVTINGDFTINGSAVSCNRTTGGTPSLTVNGSIIFQNKQYTNAGAIVAWGFIGTSSSGSANITVTGNIDMSAMLVNQNAFFHISNERDANNTTTIGGVTLTVGSIVLGSFGHFDCAFSALGGNASVYVNGSITGSGSSIMGGAHGANRTDANAPTIYFKSAGSSTPGTFWMTSGDYDAANPGGYNGSTASPNGIGQFNVVIQNNRVITLASDIQIGTNRSFTVNPGGTLITGGLGGTVYYVSSRPGTPAAASTSFVLGATSGGLYSEIHANSPNGLTVAPTASGNIQTITRTYAATANYQFDNTTSQVTGDFMTSNGYLANKLIVDNTAAALGTGLTLSNKLTITSSLQFLAGRLITTTTNLPTIDVSGASSGYTMSPTNTAYVNGPLAKSSNSTTAFTFPVGNSALTTTGTFRPIQYTPSAATAATYQVILKGSTAGAFLSTLSWVEPLFYWDAQYIAGTTTVAAKFYYGNTDITAAPMSLKNYYVTSAQYNVSGASKWNNIGYGGMDSVSSLHYVQPAANISPVSGKFLAIAQSISPLPIELLSFTGANHESHNTLNWTTASEINNDYFKLERSSDNQEFTIAGIVKGAGNSAKVLSYTYNDESPFQVTYYRLKQTDYDGKYEYSKTIVVNRADQANIRLFQTHERIKINVDGNTSGILDAQLFDIRGKKISEAKSSDNTVEIETAGLPAGMHIINVNNNGVIKTFKIIL